jgi:hypothetical protein
VRVIAVDWSGDMRTARQHIWLAEADSMRPGELVRLEAGRDRQEVADHLSRAPGDDLAIGFDFAFSFPMWFLDHLGVQSAPQLWAHVAERGESWLATCEPPFWGRPSKTRPPETQPALRRTDRAVPRTAGVAPKSIFQIGGAGAVGTGSIRGMPLLRQLHAAGARIWPYCGEPGRPTVVEIYPRLMTGAVHKSRATARAELLERRYPGLSGEHRRLAVISEDAFDAAASALVMAEHVTDLAALPAESDLVLRLEGRIWHPGWRTDRLQSPHLSCVDKARHDDSPTSVRPDDAPWWIGR